MTDEELVRRVREGDNGALAEIHSRYGNHILHTAYHIVGNWADAEDIVQDVYVRMLTTGSPFEGRGSLKNWLLQITVNRSRNWRRRLRWLLLRSNVDQRAAAAQCNTESLWLLGEIRRLPEKLRIVIVLKYFHDLSERDIAKILRCPPGTVKSRLHHALRHLRANIASEESPIKTLSSER